MTLASVQYIAAYGMLKCHNNLEIELSNCDRV